MAEYHTVYKGPEGETTQWEDIQARLGNLPAKSKKQPAPKWEGEVTEKKDAAWLRSQEEGGLADAEGDFVDDRQLEAIRLQRMEELREASTRPTTGQLETIRGSEFVAQVTEASRKCWVVVLLHQDHVEGCVVLAECLAELARQHTSSKFVKIKATDCSAGFPDSGLPTVLVYHEGKCQKTFSGLVVWGGKRASAEYATFVLNEVGPICQSDGEQSEVQNARKLVQRIILQRHEQDEDSDFE